MNDNKTSRAMTNRLIGYTLSPDLKLSDVDIETLNLQAANDIANRSKLGPTLSLTLLIATLYTTKTINTLSIIDLAFRSF